MVMTGNSMDSNIGMQQGQAYGFYNRNKTLFGINSAVMPLMEFIGNNDFFAAYHDVRRLNINAVFANRLYKYAMDGSSITIDTGKETVKDSMADNLQECLDRAIAKQKKWVPMALGCGGVVLVPYAVKTRNGYRLYIDVVPQSRLIINRIHGDDLLGATIIADQMSKGKYIYTRYTNYSIDETTGNCTIRNKAVIGAAGNEVPLTTLPAWAGIEPEITLANCDSLPIAYMRCPTDNRDADIVSSVPATFGCADLIRQVNDTMEQYNNEYKNKEVFIGVNGDFVDKDGELMRERVYSISKGGLKDSSGPLFEIFSPDIRSSAYSERLLQLFALIESQCGTSAGILTPLATASGTATEVRRAMSATISVVHDVQKMVSNGIDQLITACTVLSEYFGIATGALDYKVKYSWSDMCSDDAEQWQRMMSAKQSGVISDTELRRMIYPDETEEEAQAAIAKIKAEKPKSIDELLDLNVPDTP